MAISNLEFIISNGNWIVVLGPYLVLFLDRLDTKILRRVEATDRYGWHLDYNEDPTQLGGFRWING